MNHSLVTTRLVLRPARAGDGNGLARIAETTDQDRIASLIRNSTRWWGDYGYGVWVILDRQNEELVGWVGLRPTRSELEPELLFGLATSVRGQGLATEAAQAAKDFALGLTSVELVWSATTPDNPASIAVMERIEMRFVSREELDGVDSLIYESRSPD